MLKKKRKEKKKTERNQHKPRRHPCCHHWHVSSRACRPPVRPSARPSLCSVRLCLYRTSLPMMTPMTKNSTQNARTRVLRPSSLTTEVAMAEWGVAIDVTFLFRSPSSSCDEERGVRDANSMKPHHYVFFLNQILFSNENWQVYFSTGKFPTQWIFANKSLLAPPTLKESGVYTVGLKGHQSAQPCFQWAVSGAGIIMQPSSAVRNIQSQFKYTEKQQTQLQH